MAKLPKESPPRLVLSASRRTDLVRWYPAALIKALSTRYPPSRVHTIVLVTKFPAAILTPELALLLATYDHLAAQITITGWGGTALEPAVLDPAATLASLPALLDFLGDPRRLRLRLDPLLRLSDGRDNVETARAIMRQAASSGITDFATSIVTPYAKIVPRLAAAGLALAPWTAGEREGIIRLLSTEASALGVTLAGCCLPELPKSACIDGRALQELHPEHLPCRLDHPPGQRAACGCTHSVDLGWYASHPCYSNCLYCYANPRALSPGHTPAPAP